MTEAIYNFELDGYYGKLHGAFIADIDLVNSAIGEDAYFGDVLGKHSEIYGPLETEEVKMVTASPELIKAFREILSLTGKKHIGYNPLDYIRLGSCGFCDDEYTIYDKLSYTAAQCHYCEETCCKNCRKDHDCVVDEEESDDKDSVPRGTWKNY